MALHRAAATAFWLMVVLASSFADRGPEQVDLESAAASLHNQIIQYQRSLGEIDMSPLPQNFAPSVNQARDSTSLGLMDTDTQLEMATRRLQEAVDHEHMPGLSTNLELASERLDWQQQLASTQLKQAGATANSVLGKFRQPASLGSTRRTASLLSLSGRQQPSTAIRPQKEPIALPQTDTGTKSWRQRNPAVAALLLEPVLYGYSIIVWGFVMLLTGISSAFCFYAGNKLPLRLPVAQPSDSLQKAGVNKRSQYFQYPGAPNLQGPAPFDEEDEEGVEAWVRVPIKPERQASTPRHAGYLDDESDGEMDKFSRPSSGRCRPYGYVDED